MNPEPPLVVVGKTGPAGERGILSTPRILILMIFVIGMFACLSWQIAHLRHSTHQECLVNQSHARSIRAAISTELIDVDARTDLSVRQKAQLRENYRKAMPPLVSCT